MKFCLKCMKEVDYYIEEQTVIEQVKDEKIEAKLQVAKCKECGEEMFVADIEKKNFDILYSAYREKNGLLQPTQIKSIRDKYELTQTLFAKILGLGEKTIARYENGSIQEQAQNNLIMLCESEKNFKKIFDKCKGILTAGEIEKVEKVLDRLGSERQIEIATMYCMPKTTYFFMQSSNNYDHQYKDIS